MLFTIVQVVFENLLLITIGGKNTPVMQLSSE